MDEAGNAHLDNRWREVNEALDNLADLHVLPLQWLVSPRYLGTIDLTGSLHIVADIKERRVSL